MQEPLGRRAIFNFMVMTVTFKNIVMVKNIVTLCYPAVLPCYSAIIERLSEIIA
jgi:hypothetical protein